MKRALLGLVLLAGVAEGAMYVTNATSAAFGFCPSGKAAAAADSDVYGYVAAGLAATAVVSPDFGFVCSGRGVAEGVSPSFGYVLPGGIVGTAFRYVELDASRLSSEGATAVYGVKAIPPSVGFIPSDQRLIEICTFTPYDLISDVGFVSWESGGQSWAIPVSAVDGIQGWIVRDVRAVMKIVADMTFHKPLSVARLNRQRVCRRRCRWRAQNGRRASEG